MGRPDRRLDRQHGQRRVDRPGRARSRRGSGSRGACWPGRSAGRTGRRASCRAGGSSAGRRCARDRRSTPQPTRAGSRFSAARSIASAIRAGQDRDIIGVGRGAQRPHRRRAPSACASPRSASGRWGSRSSRGPAPWPDRAARGASCSYRPRRSPAGSCRRRAPGIWPGSGRSACVARACEESAVDDDREAFRRDIDGRGPGAEGRRPGRCRLLGRRDRGAGQGQQRRAAEGDDRVEACVSSKPSSPGSFGFDPQLAELREIAVARWRSASARAWRSASARHGPRPRIAP